MSKTWSNDQGGRATVARAGRRMRGVGKLKAELCVALIVVIALHVQMVLNSAPALDSSHAACCKRSHWPIRCFPAVLKQRSRAGVYSHFCIAVFSCRIV
jgi:hypothetical protein